MMRECNDLLFDKLQVVVDMRRFEGTTLPYFSHSIFLSKEVPMNMCPQMHRFHGMHSISSKYLAFENSFIYVKKSPIESNTFREWSGHFRTRKRRPILT